MKKTGGVRRQVKRFVVPSLETLGGVHDILRSPISNVLFNLETGHCRDRISKGFSEIWLLKSAFWVGNFTKEKVFFAEKTFNFPNTPKNVTDQNFIIFPDQMMQTQLQLSSEIQPFEVREYGENEDFLAKIDHFIRPN